MDNFDDFSNGKWFMAETTDGTACHCVRDSDATLNDGLAGVQEMLGATGQVFNIRESNPDEVLAFYKKMSAQSMVYSTAYH